MDSNRGGARCTLEGDPPAVRLGLARVKGISVALADGSSRSGSAAARTARSRTAPVARHWRPGRPRRWCWPAPSISSGAREELLWDAYALAGADRPAALELPAEGPVFPTRPVYEQTLLDYAVLGLSLDHHLVQHYRRRLAGLRVVASTALGRWAEGAMVRVGGLVNVIVRPDVYARCRPVLREQPLVAIAGRVQRRHGLVNVVAERARGLVPSVPDPERAARRAGQITLSAIDAHDLP